MSGGHENSTFLVFSCGLCYINAHLSQDEISEKQVIFVHEGFHFLSWCRYFL